MRVGPKLVTCLPESGLDVLDVDLRAGGSGHEEIIQRGLAAETAVIQGGAASGRIRETLSPGFVNGASPKMASQMASRKL